MTETEALPALDPAPADDAAEMLRKVASDHGAAREYVAHMLTTVSRLRRELAGAEADLEGALAVERRHHDLVRDVFGHYRATMERALHAAP